MTIREIDAYMSNWAKPSYSASWDNDGIMLCLDRDREITRVTVALEINADVIAAAVKNGSELIITHHPFIFYPIKRIDGAQGSEGEYLHDLLKYGISVLSYHTRLDCAAGGVNDALCEKLSLSYVKPFGEGEAPMGRVGILPQETDERRLAEYVKARLGCGTMRCVPVGKKHISRVAVLGGSGKDELFEAAKVADAFITADLTHNAFITAKELLLFAMDAGHYHTENPVIYTIAARLRDMFPVLTVDTADVGSPFTLM